jgi:hypothetical protein
MNFTGKYEGTLWYGEGYQFYDSNAELTFQMVIDEENGWFSGVAIDLEGAGKSPHEASVDGKVDASAIGFSKVYKFSHASGPDGNTIIDDKQKGFPILYNGTFNQETGSYEGTWKYIVVRRYWLLFKRMVNYGSGTFQMRKS